MESEINGNASHDHYKILGITQDASDDQIRTAHRIGVKKFHPDAGGNASVLIQINEAYRVLKDPDLRREFDSYQQAVDASEDEFDTSDTDDFSEDVPPNQVATSVPDHFFCERCKLRFSNHYLRIQPDNSRLCSRCFPSDAVESKRYQLPIPVLIVGTFSVLILVVIGEAVFPFLQVPFGVIAAIALGLICWVLPAILLVWGLFAAIRHFVRRDS